MLITGSTDGQFGHKALLETLKVIEAKNIDKHQLVIQFVKTKIDANGKITDEKTLEEVKKVVANFIETLTDNKPVDE
jgi:hypothetical protein